MVTLSIDKLTPAGPTGSTRVELGLASSETDVSCLGAIQIPNFAGRCDLSGRLSFE
jgi:hypothetical protein